jgi:hypothetical protein
MVVIAEQRHAERGRDQVRGVPGPVPADRIEHKKRTAADGEQKSGDNKRSRGRVQEELHKERSGVIGHTAGVGKIFTEESIIRLKNRLLGDSIESRLDPQKDIQKQTRAESSGKSRRCTVGDFSVLHADSVRRNLISHGMEHLHKKYPSSQAGTIYKF